MSIPHVPFEVVRHVSATPGPTVGLIGGVHGDEEEGVLAVQRVSALLRQRPLVSGAVQAVAVAHPAAYAANQRDSPTDGLNLARCFPGDTRGRPTERLANELTQQVVRTSDLVVDVHSAGRNYGMPTFVGYVRSAGEIGGRSRRAAMEFGTPLIWEHPGPPAPGRSISAAFALGIASIYVEGSGGGSLCESELELYVGGICRVLADLQMLSWRPPAPPRGRRLVLGGDGNLDAGITAPCSGRFVARSRPGDALAAGDSIGHIVDKVGNTVEEIVAPSDAMLMFLRRSARIAAGEVICALGAPAIHLSTPGKPGQHPHSPSPAAHTDR